MDDAHFDLNFVKPGMCQPQFLKVLLFEEYVSPSQTIKLRNLNNWSSEYCYFPVFSYVMIVKDQANSKGISQLILYIVNSIDHFNCMNVMMHLKDDCYTLWC